MPQCYKCSILIGIDFIASLSKNSFQCIIAFRKLIIRLRDAIVKMGGTNTKLSVRSVFVVLLLCTRNPHITYLSNYMLHTCHTCQFRTEALTNSGKMKVVIQLLTTWKEQHRKVSFIHHKFTIGQSYCYDHFVMTFLQILCTIFFVSKAQIM